MPELLVTGQVTWTEQREETSVTLGPTNWELSFSGTEKAAKEFALEEIGKRYPTSVKITVRDVESLEAAQKSGHPRKDR